ncbi:transmembrane protein 138 [Phlebotomus argentipes]|uniref:transmembrane protein 138 n=1 Tax=Phlebotomus argentipes TaxID=94469 RepID=UPI002892C1D0|nr:transmembrane protein 138 [Phlebotomus argentipes]
MFKLSLKKYSAFLIVQFSLLLFDLSVNTFSFLAKSHLISIYIAQDIGLVISFLALIYSLCSTYVYQAGLSELLYTKFRSVFGVLIIYFLLCILAQVTFYTLPWPKTITALCIIQRLFSPFYYYSCKRASLRMSDPRFYENLDWISEQMAIK